MQEMTPQVNEHLIKVSAGLMVVDNPLTLGQDVTVLVKGSITKIEQKDNNDGTYDQVYIVKGIIGEVIGE